MRGDQADFAQRIQSLLPASWFPADDPVVNAITQAPAWALSSNYAQQQYARLQTRIATATDGWLDLVSHDYFNGALPRLPNETDANFRARIQASLFIQGPTRADLSRVLSVLTGRAPLIIEPSNPFDCGGWDLAYGWDLAGAWGDPLPYQSFVTAFRPLGTGIPKVGGWDASAFGWDIAAQGEWTEQSQVTDSVTDAAIIAAVESTRALGTVIWLRIVANPNPTTGRLGIDFVVGSSALV